MSFVARILLFIALAAPAFAQEPYITVASTISTQDSGLFGPILPAFKAKTGITVRVVALGTGQALALGRRGDADVLFVHDREAELKFTADGDGLDRREVMYNDFILVGPKSDPAKIGTGKDPANSRPSSCRFELAVGTRYGVTVWHGSPNAVERFVDYMLGSDGQRTLQRYGFR